MRLGIERERGGQGLLDLARDRRGLEVRVQDDVAARDVGRDVGEPEALEESPQRRHRDLVPAADVDPAEEQHERPQPLARHAVQSSQHRRAIAATIGRDAPTPASTPTSPRLPADQRELLETLRADVARLVPGRRRDDQLRHAGVQARRPVLPVVCRLEAALLASTRSTTSSSSATRTRSAATARTKGASTSRRRSRSRRAARGPRPRSAPREATTRRRDLDTGDSPALSRADHRALSFGHDRGVVGRRSTSAEPPPWDIGRPSRRSCASPTRASSRSRSSTSAAAPGSTP